MRSIVLHFADSSEAQIAESLRRLGALEQNGAPWIYPARGEPVLYINWCKDYDEITVPGWRALEQELGTGPEVSVIADVSGRVPGEAEVRTFVLHLLRAHRGAAQDDHSEHVWSVAELEADAVVAGRRFFVG